MTLTAFYLLTLIIENCVLRWWPCISPRAKPPYFTTDHFSNRQTLFFLPVARCFSLVIIIIPLTHAPRPNRLSHISKQLKKRSKKGKKEEKSSLWVRKEELKSSCWTSNAVNRHAERCREVAGSTPRCGSLIKKGRKGTKINYKCINTGKHKNLNPDESRISPRESPNTHRLNEFLW